MHPSYHAAYYLAPNHAHKIAYSAERKVLGVQRERKLRASLHVDHSHSYSVADVGAPCILYTITDVLDWKTHLVGKDETDRCLI